MRKSRVKLTEIDPTIIQSIAKEPIEIFNQLVPLAITMPSWTNIVFFCQDPSKSNLDIMFFEDVQDFFVRYAKMVIRRPAEVNLFCFINKGKGWQSFDPPTLIGANLETRLRPTKASDDVI